MVFGFDFFARRPPPTTPSPPVDPSTSPRVSFISPHPAPSPPTSTSPSPPPLTDEPTPAPLIALLTTIPSPTLKQYILSTLSTPTPSAQITALTTFFSALTPPPELHCVRCHKSYYDVENGDRSCLIPHDDESALVERVKGAYETLWGCCGRTVEGDGDMGPPDGWCYEGKHTTDPKRARFRADSTPSDDKLSTCVQKRCFASPAISTTRSRRKRTLSTLSLDKSKDKVRDEEEMSVGTSSSRGKRRKTSISATAKRKGKAKSKEFIDSDDEMDVDVDADIPAQTPPSPPLSTTRKPPSSSTASSRSSRKSPARSVGRKATPKSPLSTVLAEQKKTAIFVSSPAPSTPIPIPTATGSGSAPRRSASLTRSGTVPVVEIISRPGSPLAKLSAQGDTVYVTPSPLKPPSTSTSTSVPKPKMKSMKSKSKSSLAASPQTGGLKKKSSSASIKRVVGDEDVFGKSDKEERGRVKRLVDVIDSSVDGERKGAR
ncbi:hypothetical protein BDQ17DRAFT_1359928 [Cyathus striatus]|nr:hypothetical protein BDQ17DRAFT_1359928 [Cyathus striatus]